MLRGVGTEFTEEWVFNRFFFQHMNGILLQLYEKNH